MDKYLNKVTQGDCLELMKELPDNSVDLVLTDPPYGIGESNEKNSSRGCLAKTTDFKHYEWDYNKIEKEYFTEIFRVSKNQIIFGGNYYIEFLYNSSCWVVWDKDNGKTDFADCELAWTSFKTAVRKVKWQWQGMLQGDMKNKETRYHPTQKPIPVFSWILRNYSKENNTILDPFMGSGTTAIACIKTNRQFIGFDLEQQYVDIANKRIKNEQAQMKLF